MKCNIVNQILVSIHNVEFFFTRKLTFHFMQEYRITEVPPRKWRLYKYLRHRKHPEGNVTVTENLQEEMVLS